MEAWQKLQIELENKKAAAPPEEKSEKKSWKILWFDYDYHTNTQYDSTRKNIVEQLNVIDAGKQTQEQKVTNKAAEINNIKQQIAVLQGNIAKLETDKVILMKEIKSLDQEIKKAEKEFAEIQAEFKQKLETYGASGEFLAQTFNTTTRFRNMLRHSENLHAFGSAMVKALNLLKGVLKDADEESDADEKLKIVDEIISTPEYKFFRLLYNEFYPRITQVIELAAQTTQRGYLDYVEKHFDNPPELAGN